MHRLTSPVSTDYLGLSVGGPLSAGGIGGASSRYGLQADNVIELEVVTGDGRLLRCSADENRELFLAVLGGLGQFAIIVRAAVRLLAAEATARIHHLSYTNLDSMTADQRTALADGRLDYLEGHVLPVDAEARATSSKVPIYYTAPLEPDDEEVLAGLNPETTDIVEQRTSSGSTASSSWSSDLSS